MVCLSGGLEEDSGGAVAVREDGWEMLRIIHVDRCLQIVRGRDTAVLCSGCNLDLCTGSLDLRVHFRYGLGLMSCRVANLINIQETEKLDCSTIVRDTFLSIEQA